MSYWEGLQGRSLKAGHEAFTTQTPLPPPQSHSKGRNRSRKTIQGLPFVNQHSKAR